MAFSDRDWARDSGSGGNAFGRVLRALDVSFPVGRVVGIAIRVHVAFPLLVAIFLLADPAAWAWTLRATALLFVAVLLHEFGHCLACRRVGGEADRILMWPLGGLASCRAPATPFAEFVTVAGGPLVSLVLAILPALALLVTIGADAPITWNPFRLFSVPYGVGPVAALVADFHAVNWLLFCFNMALVFYPFDGGRLVQIALWTRLGRSRSLWIATGVGMVGAIGIVAIGLVARSFLLALIGVFGFVTCLQQRRMLAMGAGEADEVDAPWASSLAPDPEPGRLERWRETRRERQVEREQEQAAASQAEIDAILEKVHREGMEALTRAERRRLEEATRRAQR